MLCNTTDIKFNKQPLRFLVPEMTYEYNPSIESFAAEKFLCELNGTLFIIAVHHRKGEQL